MGFLLPCPRVAQCLCSVTQGEKFPSNMTTDRPALPSVCLLLMSPNVPPAGAVTCHRWADRHGSFALPIGLAMEPLPGDFHPDVCMCHPHMLLRVLPRPRTEGKSAWFGSFLLTLASHVQHTLFRTSAAKQKKLLETRSISHRRERMSAAASLSRSFPSTEAACLYEQRVRGFSILSPFKWPQWTNLVPGALPVLPD